ncbi:AAA family ATPase [Amycolatopsis jiangsuensis]|uniref:DNA primase/polymerase bifunctional N-terminal domain-containing protein n=1 Tax=Amycolatopsis jiangsuensis TaxID=1181879 RepID=A0A840J8X0_9PSEU|nr:AAA family ATPase [Amycolatopsis jiangsuensis]MBB4689807.1 hypothetical protein [Amycolatopsis jiangsuensis]
MPAELSALDVAEPRGPYERGALAWWAAGWEGVVPLGARAKWPPPAGRTGWAGVNPSYADVYAWAAGPEGAGNIALRLPRGVYGLDVDAYGAKTGAEALAALEAQHGPLPDTWVITSRDDGRSGIRLFRAALPEGRRWKNEPGGHGRGIESIHYGHRYAVTWPSVHPSGSTYVLRSSRTWEAHEGAVPVDELPQLPAAWVDGLSEPGEIATGSAASDQATRDAVAAFRDGETCEPVRRALSRALERVRDAVSGDALHPAGLESVHELARLGHEGHAGVRQALTQHHEAFVEARAGRGASNGDAEGEWWRMIAGAVGKAPGAPRAECDCALLAGEGLLFEFTPAEVMPGKGEEGDERAGVVAGMTVVDPVDFMLNEMLSFAEVARREPPAPLVSELLYLDTLAWLIGKPGSFKSFVALDLAAHVALGRAWAGRRVRQGVALYVVAEGLGGIVLRARAWQKVRGEVPDEFLRLYPRAVQVRNAAHWDALVEVARRLRPALIVLDTQARVAQSVRENDNTEMGEFVGQLDRLRRASGACVLTVHHVGRNGEDARGASSLDGAQDTELKVERVGGPKALTARLVVDKQKDGADTDAVSFEMVPVDLGVNGEGDPVSSLVVDTNAFVSAAPAQPWKENTPEKLARILDVLHEQFSQTGATGYQVLSVLKERGWDQEYSKTSFYRCWNTLIKDEQIGKMAGSQRFKAIVAAENPAGD